MFLVFLRGDSNPERVGAFKKYAGGMFLAPRGAAACCKPARFCAAKALSPLEHQRKDGQTTVFFSENSGSDFRGENDGVFAEKRLKIKGIMV